MTMPLRGNLRSNLLLKHSHIMPYKVQLKHPHATEPQGLGRGKVVGLATAHEFGTFMEAQRGMNAWLDYSGRERRGLWTGQVITSQGAPA